MNDKELNKNIKKSLENFIKELATNPEKVFDNDKLQIKYNNLLKEKIKVQSNWNSLRKELKQAYRELFENELVNGRELINNILDKMDELEGVNNE